MKSKIEKTLRENLHYLAMSEIEKTVDAICEVMNVRECGIEKVDKGEFAFGDRVVNSTNGDFGHVGKDNEGRLCFHFYNYQLPIIAKFVVKR